MQLNELVPGESYALGSLNNDGSLPARLARGTVIDGVVETASHGYTFVRVTITREDHSQYESQVLEREAQMTWDEYQTRLAQQRTERRQAALVKKAHIEVINAFMARFGTTSKVYTTERIGDGVCAVIESEALIAALDAGVIARDQHRAQQPVVSD